MPINKDLNTRVNLIIPKELKQQLEVEAKVEGRSLNNYIIYVLNKRQK